MWRALQDVLGDDQDLSHHLTFFLKLNFLHPPTLLVLYPVTDSELSLCCPSTSLHMSLASNFLFTMETDEENVLEILLGFVAKWQAIFGIYETK